MLATDICEEALAVAEVGRFDALALRAVPPLLRTRYFEADGDAFRISPGLRAMVRFERKNLQDALYPRGFDLILCRNVLIYFDRTGRDRVIGRLAESLLPGGYLFLGYSETLRGFEEHFDVIRTDEGALYRRHVHRPTAAPGASVPRPAAQVAPARPGVRRITTPYGAVLAPPQPTPPPAAPPPPVAGPPHVHVEVRGHFGEDAVSDLAALLQPALSGTSRAVILDLDAAELLSDGAARVLGRARRVLDADGRVLVFVCRRPGVLHWVRRHGLDGGLRVAETLAEAIELAGRSAKSRP